MEKNPSTPKVTHEASPAQEKKSASPRNSAQTLKKTQQDLAEANEKYIRLYSEFENFRKRVAKEKLALIETASAGILKKLLPILDDFERALEAFKTTDTAPQATQEGVRLIYEKLMHLLEQAGVKSMPLDKGAVFDTEFHEAVTQMPVEDSAMQGKVLDVLEKGYLLQEKVLRFAKVVTGA